MLIITILLAVGTFCQVSPTWQRNPNIDAGQSKPVNLDVSPADAKNPGSIYDYNQHFNKTNFSVIPRVVIAQLAFGFFTNATNNQSLMGYNITMGSINSLNFTYRVETFGVVIDALHYIYLAVSPIYDDVYHMQNYYISFSSSDALANISLGASRTQTISLNNPGSHITNNDFSGRQMVLQAWILCYQFTPATTLSLNMTAISSSNSTFDLEVQVKDSLVLSQLGITVVLVNTTVLLEYSYTQYLDVFFTQYEGVGYFLYLSNTLTIPDFSTMYFYRNNLYGHTGLSVLIDSKTFYYYNFSMNATDIRTTVGISQRSRVCPSSDPYYFYQNQTCIPSCPEYYFTNTTFDFCKSCHYSCLNCSQAQHNESCIDCDTSQNRQFTNTSCPCVDGYFDNNTLLCVQCHTTCATCYNELSIGCLSCNSSLNRELLSGQCKCLDGYFDNGSLICSQCHFSCLTCDNETSSDCLTCNSSLNRQLSSRQCICVDGYTDNGTVCEQSLVCGNGFLSAGEECDDGNNDDLDGCSSLCLVQADHSCISNASLSASSICYYSSPIGLALEYVFKVPLQNKVQMTLEVSAANINQQLLKRYLQTSATSLTFESRSRLLATTSISDTQTSYQTFSSLLFIAFSYNSSIDLTTINLQVNPSNSTTSNAYFYDSPQVLLQLTSPNNKLLTTFLSDEQKAQQRLISWFFLAVIAAAWLYIIVGVILNQSAAAVEFMLVVQIAYETLVQSQFIYEAWSGLVLYGKYTYGANVENVVQTRSDTLTTLGINIPLVNTLNITTGFLFISMLLILIIFFYEAIDKSRLRQNDEVGEAASSVNIQQDPQVIRKAYAIKRIIVTYSLEVGLTLSFMSVKIVFISLGVSIRESKSILPWLLPGLFTLACSIVLWIFFFFSYDLEYLKHLSFRRLLRNTAYQDQLTFFQTFANALVKYHYLILFTSFAIFGIVNSFTSLTKVMFILVMLTTLLWGVLIFINNHYYRKAHRVRSVMNTVCVIVLMIVLLLQSLSITNPSQTVAPAVVGLSVLFVGLVINWVIFGRIEYRRRCKKQLKRTKKQKNKIVNLQMETEQPIQLQPQPPEHKRQKVSDSSQLDMYIQDKLSEQRPEAYNYQLTHKKMLKETPDNQNITTKKKQNPQTPQNDPNNNQPITLPKKLQFTTQKPQLQQQNQNDFEQI